VRRLRAELWRQENWLLHHDNAPAHTSSFTSDFFYQKQNDCRSTPILLVLFPRLKIKLKGRNFDTIEVIKAESEAVLNTLTDHDFQDTFTNGRSAGNSAYSRKGTTSSVMVANRPKVSF
jgi:hypothetical protein